MGDETVELAEAAGIEQDVQTFAGRVASRLVLPLDALVTAPQAALFAQLAQPFYFRIHCHQVISK